MTEEKRFQVALSLIPKIGPVLSKQLISHLGSASAIFKTSAGKLSKVDGIGSKLLESLKNLTPVIKKADTIIEESDKKSISINTYLDEDFPKELSRLTDSPIVIYSKGNIDFKQKKKIAIVGTRKATAYGKSITDQIVSEAKSQQTQIISGLAYGIDIAAHRAALTNGLSTIAVMACGLDQVYPASHRNTLEKMLMTGGAISEYPIGTKADPRFFPARNRLIAGLCSGLIVVEAAEKGGALITANIAHSYDIPVFAVPGELGKTYSKGCNQLIKSLKAQVYTEFDDVVRCLNWDLDNKESLNKEKRYLELDLKEKKVIDALLQNNSELDLDSLSWQSQINLNQLASILLILEFKGLVKPLPGKKFKLI